LQLVLFSVWFETVLYLEELEYAICAHELCLFPFNGKNFFADLREPFTLQKGWLLWAGVGLVGALLAIGLTGYAVSFFNGETPQRDVSSLF
jgi:hypothetical protein